MDLEPIVSKIHCNGCHWTVLLNVFWVSDYVYIYLLKYFTYDYFFDMATFAAILVVLYRITDPDLFSELILQ